MVVLTVKLVALTLSVTWGLTKTILFGVGLPVILAVLFIAGLTAFAVPLLILALLIGACYFFLIARRDLTESVFTYWGNHFYNNGRYGRGVHGTRQRVCPDFVQKGD